MSYLTQMQEKLFDFRWSQLIDKWKQTKKPLPDADKLEICQKLLKLQEKQVKRYICADSLSDAKNLKLKFSDLFMRTENGYRWHDLMIEDDRIVDELLDELTT